MRGRLRVVIVDDMALARERVVRYLAEEAAIEIVGEASNGTDAVGLIVREGPDVAFLDVGLPDFDGFEIVRRLPPQTRPLAIFLTAHADKALEAFDESACDYLAKPFTRERFARALNRAREQLRLRQHADHPPRQYLRRLAIKEKQRIDVVDVCDIDYIDVAGHYLCVHVGKRVRLIRGQLVDIEENLDPAEFARVHRSTIVRIDRVRSLVARSNGDSDLILCDGSRVLMSRTYRVSLAGRLGLDTGSGR
jgi:two-component system, LytTR family, response regulator